VESYLTLAVTLPDPSLLETITSWTWNILSVGAGLTFVIFVHELGHFLVAKACGVKCEKFYVGFDFFEFKLGPIKIPRALFKFQWGETEYGLGSLPLGGYVKMLGQDDDPRNAEAEAARIRSDSDKARAEAIASGTAAEGLASGQSVEQGTQQALAAQPLASQGKEGTVASPEAAVPAKTTDGKTVLLDPRSYPAKSVPARMAIISAGVIMNLIFAVILAAIAFKLGVQETPAIIGGTTPASVPWKLGVEPGSKVMQIGERGKPYDHIRWEDFGTVAILNQDQDVPMLVRGPDGQDKWYKFRPTKNPVSNRPMIGVAMPRSRQVNIFPDFAAHLNPQASPPLEDYDLIEEVAGQQIASGEDLTKIMCQAPLGSIKLKVRRPSEAERKLPPTEWTSSPKTIETTLAPKPMRELGIAVKMGPIVAIRDGSPAAEAGFLVDDVIVEIDGDPVGDPLSLSQRLTPGETPEPKKIVVSRKDRNGKASRKTLTVTPQRPLQSSSYLVTNPAAIEPIGVAFTVTNEVAAVEAGSPAAQAKLQPGDVLTKVEFLPPDNETTEKLQRLLGQILFEPIDLKDKGSWTDVVSRLQSVSPETKVKLTWTRGKSESSAELAPLDSASLYDDLRGIELYTVENKHIAADWGEAFRLGFRETTDKLTQVVMILHRLVTGRLSPTNLSGPPGIIAAAGIFASQGLASLLIFLTILSANLAILNFLPIPALDGGHMLFLAYEGLTGKPAPERVQMRLTVAGVLCLLGLMVFATAMDIGRFAQMIQRWF
jgi:regulator of sigma E protease